MTRLEEAIRTTKEKALKVWHDSFGFNEVESSYELIEAISTAVRELEKEPKEITFDDVQRYCKPRCLTIISDELLHELIQPKIKTCKDCKWWKDSDGVYRRDIGAESQCPMNRKEVYEGNGYCFLFKPQESEGRE